MPQTPIAMEEGEKKAPVVYANESPIADEEIMREEAPMVERENPAVSPNGSGQHLKHDDVSGWVVHLNQATDTVHEKMENTKL